MNEYMIPPLPTVPRYTVHAHDTVQGVSYRLPRHCQYSLTALSVEQHRAHTYTHTSTIEQYSISLPTLYYNRTMVRSTTARFFVDILVAHYRYVAEYRTNSTMDHLQCCMLCIGIDRRQLQTIVPVLTECLQS